MADLVLPSMQSGLSSSSSLIASRISEKVVKNKTSRRSLPTILIKVKNTFKFLQLFGFPRTAHAWNIHCPAIKLILKSRLPWAQCPFITWCKHSLHHLGHSLVYTKSKYSTFSVVLIYRKSKIINSDAICRTFCWLHLFRSYLRNCIGDHTKWSSRLQTKFSLISKMTCRAVKTKTDTVDTGW